MERSRGRGVPAPARSLAGSAALRSPPARWTRRFQSRPAPPPARPAPGPSSVPPHSRSSAPSRASASLQTRPSSLPCASGSGSSRDPRPGAVRRVVLNPRALPLCAGAGASRCHPCLGQTTSRRAAGTARGTGHGTGKVTEPREVGTVFGACPRVMGCYSGIGKGARGRWVKHLDIHSLHSWTAA